MHVFSAYIFLINYILDSTGPTPTEKPGLFLLLKYRNFYNQICEPTRKKENDALNPLYQSFHLIYFN